MTDDFKLDRAINLRIIAAFVIASSATAPGPSGSG